MIITVLLYALTLAAVYYAITGIIQGFFAALIGRLFGVNLGIFIGGLITWEIIDWIWILIDGDHIPITVVIGSITLLVMHGVIGKDQLNENAKLMMSAEQWVLIVLGIYLVATGDPTRWF